VFSATPKLSTYIFALMAGPYHEITDTFDDDGTSPDSILIRQLVREGEYGTVCSDWLIGPIGVQMPLGIYTRQSMKKYLDPEELFTLTKQVRTTISSPKKKKKKTILQYRFRTLKE
jgi:aminopeptidase N